MLTTLKQWLALSIGNSQTRWAAIASQEILAQGVWPSSEQWVSRDRFPVQFQTWPLVVTAVVPTQLQSWSSLPNTRVIALDNVPLAGKYATLGCDRALAAYGAIQQYGAPVLVVDGGTAWTFTAIDAHQTLIGGAILPGLALQYQSLSQGTAALPQLAPPAQLPPRWSQNTPDAIQSGILYTLLAGLESFVLAWQKDYPEGAIVCTGGSGDWIAQHLESLAIAPLHTNPDLIIQGMIALLSRA